MPTNPNDDDPANNPITSITTEPPPVASRTRSKASVRHPSALFVLPVVTGAQLLEAIPKNRLLKYHSQVIANLTPSWSPTPMFYDINQRCVAKALLCGKYFYDDLDDHFDRFFFIYREHIPKTYAFLTQSNIPYEIINSSEWPQWEAAMERELHNLKNLNTWEIVKNLPPGHKPLTYKWVFKKKFDILNKLIYKARLTVKGCHQRQGIDFTDTFAPVAKLTAIRLLLAYTVSLGFVYEQFDVQNAFPNAPLNDDVYMVPPEQLNLPYNTYLKLLKALYGLKQAGREWNSMITKFLLSIGFLQLRSDSCLFIYVMNQIYIILALYVDDMIVAAKLRANCDWLYDQLSKQFKVTRNTLTRCIGMDILHDTQSRTLRLHRHDYINTLITRYDDLIKHIPNNTVTTPLPDNLQLSTTQGQQTNFEKETMAKLPYREILGKLNYITCLIRADISFATNYLARFMTNPGPPHWNALLHLLAYLRDNPYAEITYGQPENVKYILNDYTYSMEPNRLYCFVDADFASSDLDTRRSVTGYVIFFNGGIVSWRSALQRRTSASSTESEYRSLHEACKECIWLTNILKEFGLKSPPPVVMFEDNTSTIAATQNPVSHSKLKHLDTIYHQVRDFVKDGQVIITHISTENQLADIFTKSLNSSKTQNLSHQILNSRDSLLS